MPAVLIRTCLLALASRMVIDLRQNTRSLSVATGSKLVLRRGRSCTQKGSIHSYYWVQDGEGCSNLQHGLLGCPSWWRFSYSCAE